MSYLSSDLVLSQRAGLKHELRLARRALPFRPVEFPREQRHAVRGYQGTPEATIQQFAPSWPPIRLRGAWRDAWLGGGAGVGDATWDGLPLLHARDVRDRMDQLLAEAIELELVWGREEQWRGAITQFTPSYTFPEDIEWSLTFTPVGKGLTVAIPSYTAALDAISLGYGILTTASAFLSTVNGALQKVQAYRARVTAHLARIKQLSVQLQKVLEATADVAISPITLASQIIQTGAALGESYGVVGRIAQQGNAAVLGLTGATGDLVQAYGGSAEIANAARVAGARNVRGVATAQAAISPRVIKLVRATETTDVTRLAVEAYGTPDGAAVIMAYNGLQSPVVPPGRIVRIPEWKRAA